MTAADKKFIRRRFSDAGGQYRGLADIQSVIARDLVTKACVRKNASILDVGAGDGVLAEALVLSGADVVALDCAWGMVRQGQRSLPRTTWIQADAVALPLRSKQFDMVISSSAYQWVDDLPSAFIEVRRILKPGGCFMVAMFAYGTLDELFVSMKRAAHADNRTLPVLRRLPSEDDVRSALSKAGFKDPKVSIEKRVTQFHDVKAILSWLKGIGANSAATNFFWGKSLLAGTEKEYRLNFADGNNLRATFEVVWIEAGV
jgi:malonyl-CoA O-methyltransferase